MSRAARGSLWLLFPPAGWIASRRAGRKRDVKQLEHAIAAGVSSARLVHADVPTHLDEQAGRLELIEALTATANSATASSSARKHAEKKLRQLGQ